MTFFQTFDWVGLQKGTITPEFIPKIRSPIDASNFDRFERNEEDGYNNVPEDNTHWAKDF